MGPRLLTVTFVFAVLILLSRSVYAASLCVEPGLAHGVASAEMIFTGKITKIEQVQTSTVPAGTYFVTYKVETWWKGRPSHEVRVVWRSNSVFDCPYLPVGEVGEDYLVYTDPSRSTTREQFPEVTVFNRTSRLPANRQLESFLIDDWRTQTRINPNPELNRADASDDVKLLRVLRACGCLPISDSPQAEVVSTCQPCLRGRLKPF